jgi:lipopolysaccharide/colanic/teichoic acid biosynthesis glycosyltransferase
MILILLKVNKHAGAFFLHTRIGKGNQQFSVIKFKSMTDEKDENGKLLPNEQRITSFGKMIRKLSIDELPQLINVFKGDMSLIGPRPLPVRYMELYSSEQLRRHHVRPGITGWAQVNGRNEITWIRKFELDVWYVDNISVCLDFRIILLTIVKIIKGSGINASSDKVGGNSFNGSN